MHRFGGLRRLGPRALEERLRAAMHERGPFDPRLCARRAAEPESPRPGLVPPTARGWLWHGCALAMPGPLFAVLGKFGKAFVADPATGVVRGWNVRMRQSRDSRWTPALVRGRPIIYGRYEVTRAPVVGPYPDALLIDYGLGGNKPWDPLGLVRDFVVPLEDDLMLGHMWLAVGPRLVPTPSWFALARGAPIG